MSAKLDLLAKLGGDGLPDIIVANRTGDSRGSNYVCLNRGKGKFDADCIAFSHEKDGLPDIAVARSGAPNVVSFSRTTTP